MRQPGETLPEQEQWLRVTLSSIGDAVITTDTNANVTFLNPAAESLTGWSLQEASGAPLSSVFQIINEETRQVAENPAIRSLREGLVVGLANHTLLIARDGTERPIDDSAAPIRDLQGQVVGVVLVFRDVSQRRRQERILQENEERFRLLVESVKDYAIFMLDPRGIVISWNAGAEHIKGYAADEIIGQHFSRFYTPDAIATGFPDFELRTAAAVGRFEDEGWRLRKDGSKFWANVVITAVRDATGTLRGFAKVTRDLTERRKLERSKAQSEALAELNRRKDEFLAMLSHELRNPLAPISTAVQVLRLDQEVDAARQTAMSILERQVAHLTRLVDDLLEVSRISTGRIRLQPEHVDLRHIAERAVEVVRSSIAQREHELSVSPDSDPVWLHADPTRIEQVIVNLLTNAAKYTNVKGQIRLTIEREGNEAVLRVADTGVGIAPDLLPNVFDLFSQAERSLDRSQGGLGVGLTIVQRLVSMHGGHVEAHSAGLGQGSEFVVRLPLAQNEASQSARLSPEPAKRPVGGLRVLVVDDNRDAANSMAMLLRLAGHDVEVAYSAESAIGAALALRPHVMFLDIGLPMMDGYEVARRLRQHSQLQNTRIAALTGYGRDSDQKQAQEAGFDAHLVKPVDPSKIREFLEDVAAQL